MKKNTILALVISVSAALAGGSLSFAADKKAETKGSSKEQRQKMAEVHQKMADCLKSDKPMSECKQEMMKSCHEMMGKDGCPMMGGMHGHMKGMMGKGMMGDESGEDAGADHETHHPAGQ